MDVLSELNCYHLNDASENIFCDVADILHLDAGKVVVIRKN